MIYIYKSTHLIREGVFLVSFEAFDSHWESLPLGASDIAEAPALSVLHINGEKLSVRKPRATITFISMTWGLT